MVEISKGKSPFYPGQPVPVELFVGRSTQIRHILERGVQQVVDGKPVTMFIQGEYGIGKSSIAGFVQWLAEKRHGLQGIYASLSGCRSLEEVATAVLEGTLRSGALDPKKGERVRNWLAEYVGKQDLFGFTLNMEALKKDLPTLSTPFGMLRFLAEARERLADTGCRGIFLVLDEINGISSEARFAQFIKGLVDTNAMGQGPVPLLLMMCGIEERRREMIQKHQPVDRIFDIVEIETMNEQEMRGFFERAFGSVQVKIAPSAMPYLIRYSAGFPKIMHSMGDAAFWLDRDGIIDEDDALGAVVSAAGDFGKRYIDQQVLKALQSKDYHSILVKIAQIGPTPMSFGKQEMEGKLSSSERQKFGNFLQRMKKLNVLRPGEERGEYVFNSRMVRLYLWLNSQRKQKGRR